MLLLSGIAQMAVGMSVSGVGIPAKAVISAVNPATSTITLSAAATATANNVPLTITAPANIATLNGVSAADVSLQEDINLGAGENAGLVARYGGIGDKNYYLAEIIGIGAGFQAQIVKNINGTPTVLASAVINSSAMTTATITAASWSAGLATINAVNTFTAGQQVTITGMTPAGYNGTFTILSATATTFTYALNVASLAVATKFGIAANLTGTLRFDVVGSSLKLYYAPTAAAVLLLTAPTVYANDSSLAAAGLAGMRIGPSLTVDNFTAAAIAEPSQTLPFQSDFSSPGNNNQLSTNWIERAGNFNVSGSQAVAQSNKPGSAASRLLLPSANIATVTGISLADVGAQMGLSSMAVGQTLGVLTRYTGGAFTTANAYLATATYKTAVTASVNGQIVFSIYKLVNGVLTRLSTATDSIPAGTTLTDLRFETIGSSLKLYLDVNGNITDNLVSLRRGRHSHHRNGRHLRVRRRRRHRVHRQRPYPGHASPAHIYERLRHDDARQSVEQQLDRTGRQLHGLHRQSDGHRARGRHRAQHRHPQRRQRCQRRRANRRERHHRRPNHRCDRPLFRSGRQ